MSNELSNTAKNELAAPTSGLQIAATDIDIPMINVVQKLSEIDGPIGSVVLDKKHVLAEADSPLSVCVINARKAWKENIPFDSDQRPQIANSEAERNDLNDESDYDIIEFAEISFLIEQPEDSEDDSAFGIPIGDKNYALGRIYVTKDAYRQTYKRLATFSLTNRDTPIHKVKWQFQSGLITKGKYSWYAPSLTATKDATDEAVVEFASSFTS